MFQYCWNSVKSTCLVRQSSWANKAALSGRHIWRHCFILEMKRLLYVRATRTLSWLNKNLLLSDVRKSFKWRINENCGAFHSWQGSEGRLRLSHLRSLISCEEKQLIFILKCYVYYRTLSWVFTWMALVNQSYSLSCIYLFIWKPEH